MKTTLLLSQSAPSFDTRPQAVLPMWRRIADPLGLQSGSHRVSSIAEAVLRGHSVGARLSHRGNRNTEGRYEIDQA